MPYVILVCKCVASESEKYIQSHCERRSTKKKAFSIEANTHLDNMLR